MPKPHNKLIIVSNRSPVVDFYKGSGPLTVGGLASALRRVATEQPTTWVFATDTANEQLENYESPDSIGYTLMPVSVGKKEYKSYYGGYSNSLIWPLFHYFPDKGTFSEEDWIHYQNVNRKFAIQILDLVEKDPDVVIWIHDYHLMLVAKYLRQFGVKNPIGFFLHIPFPTYEIFRLLPQRTEVLESLLAMDLVGFHTKAYVTNFFRSVRNLVEDVKPNEENGYVDFDGRRSWVHNFPISIDTEQVKTLIEDLPKAKEQSLEEKLQVKDRKIGLGVDRLDYTKGIYERFKALDYFFKKNTKYRGKMTFVQIAVPSRGSVPDYQEYKSKIEQLVSKINGQYGTLEWQPIIYINRSVAFEQLVKYYNMADFALVTPLRDGMNLVAKEYIVSRKENASLILSELAGAAEELTRAALVNPYNQEQIVNAIKYCLENPGYQKAVLEDYEEYLSHNDVHKWAGNFVQALKIHTMAPKASEDEPEDENEEVIKKPFIKKTPNEARN